MPSPPARKPRADALRNRDALIEAAREVLGRGGPNASLEAVARRAQVGIGTLYRHFPDRESLFHEVFRRDLQHLAEQAEALDGADDPLMAIRDWLHGNVALVETKRGMLGALSLVMTEESKQTYAAHFTRITVALNRALQQAEGEGRIRPGMVADDLLQTMYALCYARAPGPEWREQVLRLLDIFVDGMRHSRAGPAGAGDVEA